MSYPPRSFSSSSGKIKMFKSISLSFFLFGLLNNVIYVIILSAALDLVDQASTPKGLILLVNIAPALLLKITIPYFIKSKINYPIRIILASLSSFLGLLVVALSPSLQFRLVGIGLASAASGLGEMTFLQLSTLYASAAGPDESDKENKGGIAWFSSGTGAAGLVGAGLWWVLRSLGVKRALGICSILPLGMALAYYFLLPTIQSSTPLYSAINTNEIDSQPLLSSAVTSATISPESHISLSVVDRISLAKPLFIKLMLPLFFVYFAEYTINTGVAPTLIYPLPTSKPLSLLLTSLRDFYPLYQLTYQSTVFLSRSSLSFNFPALPESLLSLPTFCQLGLLSFLLLESATGLLSNTVGTGDIVIAIVLGLIGLEGIFGGLAYVNIFYHLSKPSPSSSVISPERERIEREFKIASVGFSDTLGILCASLLSLWLEGWLCGIRVVRGAVPSCLE